MPPPDGKAATNLSASDIACVRHSQSRRLFPGTISSLQLPPSIRYSIIGSALFLNQRISSPTTLIADRAPHAFWEPTPLQVQQENLGENPDETRNRHGPARFAGRHEQLRATAGQRKRKASAAGREETRTGREGAST